MPSIAAHVQLTKELFDILGAQMQRFFCKVFEGGSGWARDAVGCSEWMDRLLLSRHCIQIPVHVVHTVSCCVVIVLHGQPVRGLCMLPKPPMLLSWLNGAAHRSPPGHLVGPDGPCPLPSQSKQLVGSVQSIIIQFHM